MTPVLATACGNVFTLEGATDAQLCELFLGPGSYKLSADWAPLELRFGGGFVDVANLDVSLLDAESAAVAMGRDARWGGHTGARAVSVIEHSLVVGDLIASAAPSDLLAQLSGYLHDMPEALLQDMQSTLKRRPEMWFFRCLERRVAARLEIAFGLPISSFERRTVKLADTMSWVCEMRDLGMGPEGEAWAAERGIALPTDRLYPVAAPPRALHEMRWVSRVGGLCRKLGIRPTVRGFLP
jgi:hypothetical protein